MTREIAKKIARGITDKIECNTADIDDWAEFWGFTREEYEKFLDIPIKALEQEPCEDVVSRKAVDALVWEYLRHETDETIAFYEHFLDLPPVTPISKDCTECIAEDKTFMKMDRIKQLLNSDKLDDLEVLEKIREVVEDGAENNHNASNS